MYEIKRDDKRVVIWKGDGTVLDAPEESYLIYDSKGAATVSKLKDLKDPELLIALANAIALKV